MNMQNKVRARRVNKATNTVGQHMTLIRAENDNRNGRVFAFAVIEETNEEVYIPASLILQHKITEHDVGAGFTVRTVPNPRANGEHGMAMLMASAPLVWDGEAEEIEIDEEQTPVVAMLQDIGQTEAEFSKLAEGCDDMVLKAANNIRAAIANIQNFEIRDGVRKLNSVADELEAFRAWIDEMAPQEDGE